MKNFLDLLKLIGYYDFEIRIIGINILSFRSEKVKTGANLLY